MKTFIRGAALAAAVLAALAALPARAAPAHEIVAYYAGWKSADFPVAATLDPAQVSVVLYAFLDTCRGGVHGNPHPSAGVMAPCRNADGSARVPPDGALVLNDVERDAANLRALAALKRRKPALRILASVGGWNWSNQFSNIAASAVERATFAASAVALMRRYGLDGLDIDWEYPTAAGVPCTAGHVCERPGDKQNYVLLAGILRRAFDDAGRADGKHYAITIASGATDQFIGDPQGDSAWLVQLADKLDWINLMAYDYHMPWEPRNGNHAGLYGDPADPGQAKGYDDAAAVRRYLDAGVAPDKLVLGMPFYGYGWKGCAAGPDGGGLYQACAGAAAGGLDGSASYPFSWLVRQGYLQAGPDGRYDQAGRGYRRRWNALAKAPSLYDPAAGIFISYEDEASLREKARYLKAAGLRGAMFWELSGDSGHILGRVLATELAP
ncbi:MAG TPA: glycoside hydrolase family 18 protein [Janthinobacterium sp.]|nr:glycoside hydrolase family 18 protein [Janthinobacterium sp.]